MAGLSGELWPEYNPHGATLNHYWEQLYEIFPDWQFVLYDPGDETVLAEGHTVPLAWDGTEAGLGPESTRPSPRPLSCRRRVGAYGGQRHGRRDPAASPAQRLAPVMLQAMASLARDAGLTHLIAPVRPTLKDRYPTIPIGRYARWTRPDGSPFDPWM